MKSRPFGRDLVTPSYRRGPQYRSTEPSELFYTFNCVSCGSEVQVGYERLIGPKWSLDEILGEQLTAAAKEHFGVGVVGKSPDGGWPSMIITACRECGSNYLVYAGVREVSNSVFHVTIQGVTELLASAGGEQ